MRVFLDTSVLVAAVLQQHEAHARAFAVLARIQGGRDEGFASAHSLAEMYATLTKIPAPFRHTPEQALLSIEENVIKHFNISSLTGSDYTGLIREAALAGIRGGTVYDAILMKTAGKAGVDQIYTLNLEHFQAVAPKDVAARLSAP